MRDGRRSHCRALGIDPTTRGLSFAVLERPGHVVDWGGRHADAGRRNAGCVKAVCSLVRAYGPDVLALEDCAASGSRRCIRVRALIRRLRRMAERHAIAVRLVAPLEVRRVCTGNARATKHDVAVALAERFPALGRHLPPRRKAWMSEDQRMGIFDATGLAVVALEAATISRSNLPTARGTPRVP